MNSPVEQEYGVASETAAEILDSPPANAHKKVEASIALEARLHNRRTQTFQNKVDDLRRLKRKYESKLGRLSRPLQFAFVGSTGVVVDLAAFKIFTLALPLFVARAVGIWVAMTWNFWVNRHLTFSDRRADSAFRQYLLFCLSCTMGAVVNWSVSIGLCSMVPFFADWTMLAAFCGILAGTVFNYLFSVHVAFRKPNTAVSSGSESVHTTSGVSQ